jgi:hypothetical protein
MDASWQREHEVTFAISGLTTSSKAASAAMSSFAESRRRHESRCTSSIVAVAESERSWLASSVASLITMSVSTELAASAAGTGDGWRGGGDGWRAGDGWRGGGGECCGAGSDVGVGSTMVLIEAL